MRILIAGAGQTGVALAKYLRAEKHEIVLIDKQAQVLENLSETLDIQTVVGNVIYPSILSRSGAESADIFISVTGSDEVNMVSCSLAKKLFHVSKTVARVSAMDYQNPKYQGIHDAFSVDVMISPEFETAHQIISLLSIQGCMDMAILGRGQVRFLGLKLRSDIPFVGKNLTQIRHQMAEMNFSIVNVVRHHKSVDLKNVILHPNDEIYFFVDTGHLSYVLDAFGCSEQKLKNIVLFGGGNIGYRTAKLLEVEPDTPQVTIIEQDKKRATFLAENLQDTTIIHGDAFDEDLCDELELNKNQASVATTSSDENNVLLSLLAKRMGLKRTCALVRNDLYHQHLGGLGVDVLLNPNSVMVSAILRHLRHGRLVDDYFLQSQHGEVMEIEALKTARIIGAPLGRIKMPSGVVIGGVLRGGIFIRPRQDLRIKEGDRVFVFVVSGCVAQAEKLFTVRLSFFS